MTTTYGEMRTEEEVRVDDIYARIVKEGIELLNEKFGPTWVDHVDPTILCMTDASRCIIGQVYGEYLTGCEALGVDAEPRERHAFCLCEIDDPEDWKRLEDTWRRALEIRVAAL